MSKDNRTYMYHQLKCPKGEIFTYSEVPNLERKGWVDTPAKFGTGFRGKWYSFILLIWHIAGVLREFWIAHWKWIIGTMLAILTLHLKLTNVL